MNAAANSGSSTSGAVARRRPRIGPALSRVPLNAWRLLVFVLFIALWWAISYWTASPFLPSPLQTYDAGVILIRSGALWRATQDSLLAYLSGYFVAAAVAIPLGLLMGGVRVFGATMEIYVNAMSATPRVAFIPLIIIFFGLGFQSKVIIIFLGAVMPILINTYAGVLNSDGELIEMARSTGARELAIFRKIMLPGALPYIVAGLRLGAAIGLINSSGNMGGFAGPFILGYASTTTNSFVGGLAVLSVSLVLGAVCVLSVRNHQPVGS